MMVASTMSLLSQTASLNCHSSSTALLLLLLLTSATVRPASTSLYTNRLGLRETDLSEKASDCTQVEEDCRDKWSSGSPVCGSNGVTYNSLCRLRRAICRGDNVRFIRNGECLSHERCRMQRATAQEDLNRHKYGVYVPECEVDGSFKPMQCHQDTGYCWCVTPSGETRGMSADGNRIRDLNCSQDEHSAAGSTHGSRSSSSGGRDSSLSSSSSSSSSCPPNSRLSRCVKEGCSTGRRIIFIDNMVSSFVTEYKRQPASSTSIPEELRSEAIVWKFNDLDSNSDGVAGRREYRNLRRLVRSEIEPKSCARKFPHLCDSNNDKRITLNEWVTCWRLKMNSAPPHEQPSEQDSTSSNRTRTKGGAKKPKKNKNNNKKGGRKYSCRKDREQELSKANGGTGLATDIIVPECDKRGRYLPHQCYGSKEKNLWFCWCVSVITGKMLRDTSVPSVNNSTPDCNNMALPTKPWPRCRPHNDKRIFLDALVQYFNKTTQVSLSGRSKQDLVRRMFVNLDTNKNSRLSRKEIKELQNKIKRVRMLKRCGRHIHRVCDANDDKNVYLKEWESCLLGSTPNNTTSSNGLMDTRPRPVRRPDPETAGGGGGTNAEGPYRKDMWLYTNPFINVLEAEDEEPDGRQSK